MLKVAFVLRNDGLVKGGGDVDLARQYGKLIDMSGTAVTSVVLSKDVKVADYGLVVLFNIDMPFESYLVARACMAANVPYVIYTLHPKASHVESFLRYGTIGSQHMAARAAGYSLLAYETIACLFRSARGGRASALLSYRTAGAAARFVLRHAQKVLVSCAGEGHYVEKDFSIANLRLAVMPHLLDEGQLASDRADAAARDIGSYVLCAGRIESRKNQMTVVEIARACPDIRFLFIGKPNANHRAYVRNFQDAVAAAPNIEWRDQVPLAELQSAIRAARAYINLSWFEVFSLIDMMALVAQTPSVLSKGSYLYDQMSRCPDLAGVAFVDANDVNAAAEALRTLPLQAVIPRPALTDDSWSEPALRAQWIDIFREIAPHAA